MDKACSVDGCPKPIRARGWCNAHYIKWRMYGDPVGGSYEWRGDRPIRAPRYCLCGCGEKLTGARTRFAKGHNPEKTWTGPSDPNFPNPNPSGLCLCGCGERTSIATRTNVAKGYYQGRHLLFRRGHGGRLRFADKTSRWKGGRIVTDQGYVKVRIDGRYIYEHRVVMEQVLGRSLAPNEQVHHINGDKLDNRPENLELWHRSQPNGVRRDDYHCPGCNCERR